MIGAKNGRKSDQVRWLLVAVAACATASIALASRPARVLTNSDAGTVIHPLLPHRAHLDRRRRELREKHGVEPAVEALPPRPHTSRHSPGDEHVRTRNLQQETGALYQGYGTHYVDVWVGSPDPQRQTVIVDTGSGVTAFPCSGCGKCGDGYHTDVVFDESKSNTFNKVACGECSKGHGHCSSGGCRITMRYAEGSSWSAYEGRDICYAGGPHDAALPMDDTAAVAGDIELESESLERVAPADASQFKFDLVFGCQTSITGLFKTQLADGIMGMENSGTAFWNQMYAKQAIPKPEFSLCFSRSDVVDEEGTGAGAMTLGGGEPRLHTTPMVFAKNLRSSGFYAVHLKAVFLREEGGTSANAAEGETDRMINLGLSESQLNDGKVIVDSGTTDTHFTRQLAASFKTAWKQLTGTDYSHSPVSLTPEQLAALPTIVLFMSGYDGDPVGDEPAAEPNAVPGYVGDNAGQWAEPRDVALTIPASHYMELDSDTGQYTSRFYVEERSGSVLGANAMMGHDVYFDTARGRIGFAQSDCDYASLVAAAGTGAAEPVPHTASMKIAVDEEMEEMEEKMEEEVEEMEGNE